MLDFDKNALRRNQSPILARGANEQPRGRSVPTLHFAILALLLLVTGLRAPTLFIEPRFWAEEATVYFRTAYLTGPWEALISPHQGYYSLWANLGGLLATLPPLEYAPAVTTWMSLLVLLTILAVVFLNKSALLDSTLKKTIAGLAMLVVGATGEIWLTTICSQHYLPLLVFLMLIDEEPSPLKSRIYLALAGMTGLSSVAANFLAPLFLLRYLQRRERSILVMFLMLCFTSVVQLGAIGYSSLVLGDAAYYFPEEQRRGFHEVDAYSVVKAIGYHAFAFPFFGMTARAWSWGACAVFLLAAYLSRRLLRQYWMPVGAVLLLSVLSVLSSMKMVGGARYGYSSAVILSLLILNLCLNAATPRIARFILCALLAASLAYWSWNFRDGMKPFTSSDWPAWKDEVRAWRQDPARKLQVHPIWPTVAIGRIWQFELPPK